MKTIGITGGVGAGKSQVLQYVKDSFCAKIIMADEVAHLVKEPGKVCYVQLCELLGNEILYQDGKIDKGLMAEKIFANKDLLSKVNDIIHPAVKNYIVEQIAIEKEKNEIEFLFIEAALLIESGYVQIVDELWYIYADRKVRQTRLQESRNYSIEKIEQIMAKQLSEEEYRRHCRVVIDNSGLITETYRQIEEVLGGCQS
ncbi:MAG: dephospho-CoA kinase [Eubacteriales bacterium]